MNVSPLVRRVKHQSLWQELTGEALPPVLPIRTVCPICRKTRGLLLHDSISDSQWYWCVDCKSSGDLIELAAALWQAPFPDTIRQLYEKGLLQLQEPPPPLAVRVYLQTLQQRQLVEDFWNRHQGLVHHADLDPLQRYVQDELTDGDASFWTLRGGQLLRAVSRAELLKLRTELKTLGMSVTPLPFASHDWEWTWMMLLHDVPGRVCGLGFLRGTEVALWALTATTPFCAILGMPILDDLPFVSPVVVFLDAFAMLRMQLQHRATHSQFLPLIAALPDSEIPPYVVSHFGPRSVIWAQGLTWEALHQARKMGGKVAIGSREDDTETRWRARSPREWMEHAQRHAMPWLRGLSMMMEKAPVTDVQTALDRLQLSPEDVADALSGCSPPVRARWQQQVAQLPTRCLRLRGVMVRCSGSSLFMDRTGELITDAIPVIHRVIRQAGSGELFYRGEILYRNERVPFTVAQTEMERDPARWLTSMLVAAGKGMPVVHPTWRTMLLHAALQLHPPAVMQGLDQWGWNEEGQQFLLAEHVIDRHGSVLRHDLIPPDTEHLPGKGWKLEDAPSEKEVAEVVGHRLATAALLAMTYHLVPTSAHRPRAGFVVHGDNAPMLWDLLDVLGCRRIELGPFCQEHSRTYLKQLNAHGWVTAVSAPAPCPRARNWLKRGEPGVLVFDLPPLARAVLLADRHWLSVHALASEDLDPEVRDSTPRVLVDFVRFALRNTSPLRGRLTPMQRLLLLWSKWLASHGMSSDPVHEAARLIADPVPEDRMLGALTELHRHGMISIDEPCRNGVRLRLSQEENGAVIHLPYRELSDLLSRRGLPCWHQDRAAASVQAALLYASLAEAAMQDRAVG